MNKNPILIEILHFRGSKRMLPGANTDAANSPEVKTLTVPRFDLSGSQRQKCVRFAEDDKLVTEFCSNVAEAWCIDRNTPNHVIIDKYAEACLKLNRPPLSTIIEQLSKITTPLTKTKIPAIKLKGTQLCKEDIEALEEIFKYCEAYHFSFENTNITDKEPMAAISVRRLCSRRNAPKYSNLEGLMDKAISTATWFMQKVLFSESRLKSVAYDLNISVNLQTLPGLLEVLDYYKPCSELCLARNKRIGSNGIRVIGNFISKNKQSENTMVLYGELEVAAGSNTLGTTYTSLTWLDLHGIPLLAEDVKHLRRAITLQRNEARKVVTDFLATCSGQEPVNPDSARDAEKDPEAFQLTFNAFISKSFATPAEVNTISGALQRLPPLCLRGLHLGETGIYGAALADIAVAIRLAGHLRDLRLNTNRIGPHDIEILAPLLRYHPNLQVIDLSHNDLGDEGYRLLSDALGHPSYPSNYLRPSSSDDADEESASLRGSVCNLRRIYLSATGLRPTGAKHFSACLLALANLTHLELSDNPHLGCQGMIALRSALQAYTRKRLVYLGLANCGLACQGAIALAEILGDSPRALRRIDLSGNNIAEAGLMAISKSIPLCWGLVHLQTCGYRNRLLDSLRHCTCYKYDPTTPQYKMTQATIKIRRTVITRDGLEDNRPIARSRVSTEKVDGEADGNNLRRNGRSKSIPSPLTSSKFSFLSLFSMAKRQLLLILIETASQ
ncbi:hypothetical protein ACTXT7_013721 [Hymenolepis weldensis]